MFLSKIFKYEFTDEQIKKFEKWKNSLPKIDEGAIGGRFTLEFTPTSLGVFVKVRSGECEGYELDLTDYDSL